MVVMMVVVIIAVMIMVVVVMVVVVTNQRRSKEALSGSLLSRHNGLHALIHARNLARPAVYTTKSHIDVQLLEVRMNDWKSTATNDNNFVSQSDHINARRSREVSLFAQAKEDWT